MTLTTVVGSSGSGKTTFLNDVHKSNKCTYIRQYHTMRPYIPVSKIPKFDPTRLPYWEIYEKEGKDKSIQVGGTMAGEFTAALDEPFAGVTDDFVPFIVERLNELRKKHNVVLVTNDHVETLTEMADNTITVSAINRSVVKVNDMEGIDRQRAIFALSLGDDYQYNSSAEDFTFFVQTEILSPSLIGVVMFSLFSHALFVATFWDSSSDSAGLVLVAGSIIAFFCINPYLLALTEWRNAVDEEAEALLHSSKAMSKGLKSCLAIALVFILSWAEYGVVQATINGLESIEQWLAMFFDSASMTFPLICLGIYSNLGFQQVEILGTMPFLLMIFLSTTFSPGSGVEGLKELRYLFSRFYWWCIVPGVQEDMEGCPDEDLNMLYMFLASIVGVVVFLFVKLIVAIRSKSSDLKTAQLRESMHDEEFHNLQVSLYGEKALKRLNHLASSLHSATSDDKP